MKANNVYNHKFIDPNGNLLFYAGNQKTKWYISRGLVEIVDKDEFYTVELSYLHEEDSVIEARKKYDHCVCCGSQDDMTKHHVIPRCFFRYYPKDYPKRLIDVLPICEKCHVYYEKQANILKNKMFSIYGICRDGGEMIPEKVRELANYLSFNYNNIDKVQEKAIIDEMSDLMGFEISENDACAYKKKYIPFGRMVIERLKSENKLDDFAEEWRTHFYKTMKLNYLLSLREDIENHKIMSLEEEFAF